MQLFILGALLLATAYFACKHFLLWFLQLYQRANLPSVLELETADSNLNDDSIQQSLKKTDSNLGDDSTQQSLETADSNLRDDSIQQSADDDDFRDYDVGVGHKRKRRGSGAAAVLTPSSPDINPKLQIHGEDTAPARDGGVEVSNPITPNLPNVGDPQAPAPAQPSLHDVFINSSVTATFAKSVYDILRDIQIRAFLDEEEVDEGESVSETVADAIRHSSVLLAILSERCAESAWCLDELCLMLSARAKLVPVFYGVRSSDLQNADKGFLKEIFLNYEMEQVHSRQTLTRWKDALLNISLLPGPHLDDFKGDERMLLKRVVQDLLKEVDNVPLEVAKFKVGLDENVQRVKEILRAEDEKNNINVCKVGITGPGGIGKTTLAKAIFNDIHVKFRGACFLSDVKDIAGKHGTEFLQSMLLKDVLQSGHTISSPSEGRELLRKCLSGVHACMVLDNVYHAQQLNDLLVPEVLQPGSVILATSRDKGLLEQAGFCVYHMTGLNQQHSEKLFCWHAFLKPHPPNEFRDVVDKVLKTCDGLPLSLEVFGGLLYEKTDIFSWETTWENMSELLPDDIKGKLKISFDGLEENQKEIFLDIACFLVGEDKNMAIRIWDGSDWDGWLNIEVLIQKSLVRVDEDNRLQMHDHLRDIGREAVKEESKQPGCRSRLWHPNDVRRVLENNEGTEQVRGLSLVSGSSIVWARNEIGSPCGWPANCFDHMNELRLLVLEDACIEGHLNSKLLNEILWLRWRRCPYKRLPSNFSITNLRVLDLRLARQLTSLWEDTQLPLNLHELDLSDCRLLNSIPNSIGKLQQLQKIVLNDCVRLVRLPEELCDLEALEHLELAFCTSLESLPANFSCLKNLQHLDFTSCEKLRKLPASFGKLSKLRFLSFQGCNDLKFQTNDTLTEFGRLETLNFSFCFQLQSLPTQITSQHCLRELYLYDVKLKVLPDDFGGLGVLEILHLFSSSLRRLPPSFGKLGCLRELTLFRCVCLEQLPESFGELKQLKHLAIQSANELICVEEIGHLFNLTFLEVVRCLKLRGLSSNLGNLSKLDTLHLESNPSLCLQPENFRQLTSITTLRLHDCPGVSDECVVSICTNMHALKTLHMEDLQISTFKIPRRCLLNLEDLICRSCKMLEKVEIYLPNLQKLDLAMCCGLKNLEGVLSSRLQYLTLKGCKQIAELPNVSNLKCLKTLDCRQCVRLNYLRLLMSLPKGVNSFF